MTQSNETVLCVILNWNGGAHIQQCVQSVLASQNASVAILVVDNGSMDGSDEMLAKNFPAIVMLKNKTNLGVVRGFNQGIQYALDNGYQHIFFLNSDAVIASNCLAVLVATLSIGERTGVVSPRILDASRENRVWFDGGVRNMFGDTIHHGFGGQVKEAAEAREEEYASGCAMLVNSSLFVETSGFDERFFAYSEDADFCFRVRCHGWRIRHNPAAVVTHRPSSSVRANKGKWYRDYYVTRNKLLLVSLYTQGMRWALFLVYFSFKYILIPIAYFTGSGQFKRTAAVFSGVHDFIVKRFGERYS